MGPAGFRDGAGDWRTKRSRHAPWAGSLPDGDERTSIESERRRILGSRAQASESGSRNATVTAGRPKVRGRAKAPRVPTRETGPGTVVERALEGENPRRAPTGVLGLARLRGRRGTDSRGEQSFEAGVPAVYRRAQRRWDEDGTCGTLRCVEATGLAKRGEPTSRLMSPGSAFGRARVATGWRDGRKRSRRSCRRCAGGGRRTNPQGSNGPRERVRLPGKGKLWRGAPRARAGNGCPVGGNSCRVAQSARRRGPRRTAGF